MLTSAVALAKVDSAMLRPGYLHHVGGLRGEMQAEGAVGGHSGQVFVQLEMLSFP